MHEPVEFGGHEIVFDPSGLLYLPAERALIVADLHLEKGSAFARRGTMLPPYDSQHTLERLGRVVSRYKPRCIISLGDGFHDHAGARLITGRAADLLHELGQNYDLLWIKGNHDHDLPVLLPGTIQDQIELGALSLQHEPSLTGRPVLCGHLHPKARVKGRQRSMSRPCFAWGLDLMIMPAFGSYTGGLNVLEPAVTQYLSRPRIALLGEQKVFFVDACHLVSEPGSLTGQQLV